MPLAAALASPAAVAQDDVSRGRCRVQVTGCNDCHTTGYGMKAGQVPESAWLQGDALGWRGLVSY